MATFITEEGLLQGDAWAVLGAVDGAVLAGREPGVALPARARLELPLLQVDSGAQPAEPSLLAGLPGPSGAPSPRLCFTGTGVITEEDSEETHSPALWAQSCPVQKAEGEECGLSATQAETNPGPQAPAARTGASCLPFLSLLSSEPSYQHNLLCVQGAQQCPAFPRARVNFKNTHVQLFI